MAWQTRKLHARHAPTSIAPVASLSASASQPTQLPTHNTNILIYNPNHTPVKMVSHPFLLPTYPNLPNHLPQPPRRRPPAQGASAASTSSKPPTAARPSKLAKENNITAQEESEIREAFSLFAEPMQGEKEGVMPIADVRRALMYAPLSPPPLHPSLFSKPFPFPSLLTNMIER